MNDDIPTVSTLALRPVEAVVLLHNLSGQHMVRHSDAIERISRSCIVRVAAMSGTS